MVGILNIHVYLLFMKIYTMYIKTFLQNQSWSTLGSRSHSKLGAKAKPMFITIPNHTEKVNQTSLNQLFPYFVLQSKLMNPMGKGRRIKKRQKWSKTWFLRVGKGSTFKDPSSMSLPCVGIEPLLTPEHNEELGLHNGPLSFVPRDQHCIISFSCRAPWRVWFTCFQQEKNTSK